MNEVIDDLAYRFLTMRAHSSVRTAKNGKINGICGTVHVDGLIPTNPRSVNHITDAIHEALQQIHTEWPKWSIRPILKNGRTYFALFFEEACLEDLAERIYEMNGFYLDENESDAVDFAEAYADLLEERLRRESAGFTAHAIYPMLFNSYMRRASVRVWRNHRMFYDSPY